MLSMFPLGTSIRLLPAARSYICIAGIDGARNNILPTDIPAAGIKGACDIPAADIPATARPTAGVI